jgi:hypothetical protein
MLGTNHPVTQEQIPEKGLPQYPIIFIKIPYIFLLFPIQHIGKISSDHKTSFFHINFFQESQWAALASGDIDMVVSEHSPCIPEMKQMGDGKGNFLSAWGGISSLQFGMCN